METDLNCPSEAHRPINRGWDLWWPQVDKCILRPPTGKKPRPKSQIHRHRSEPITIWCKHKNIISWQEVLIRTKVTWASVLKNEFILTEWIREKLCISCSVCAKEKNEYSLIDNLITQRLWDLLFKRTLRRIIPSSQFLYPRHILISKL